MWVLTRNARALSQTTANQLERICSSQEARWTVYYSIKKGSRRVSEPRGITSWADSVGLKARTLSVYLGAKLNHLIGNRYSGKLSTFLWAKRTWPATIQCFQGNFSFFKEWGSQRMRWYQKRGSEHTGPIEPPVNQCLQGNVMSPVVQSV